MYFKMPCHQSCSVLKAFLKNFRTIVLESFFDKVADFKTAARR